MDLGILDPLDGGPNCSGIYHDDSSLAFDEG